MHSEDGGAFTKMFSVPCLRLPQRLRSLWLVSLASVCLAICDAGSLSSSSHTESGQEDDLAPLTAIQAIRALTPEIAARRRRALVRGTITYINEREPAGIIVHDGSAGLFVHYGPTYFRTQPRIDLHPGDVVDVEGYTTGEGFAPALIPEVVRRLGRSPLPPAKHVPYAALLERHLRLCLHRGGRRRPARLGV